MIQLVNNETVTIRKHVSEHNNMRKWMIKSENFRIVALKLFVNSILITKSTNLQLFTSILPGLWSVVIEGDLIYLYYIFIHMTLNDFSFYFNTSHNLPGGCYGRL